MAANPPVNDALVQGLIAQIESSSDWPFQSPVEALIDELNRDMDRIAATRRWLRARPDGGRGLLGAEKYIAPYLYNHPAVKEAMVGHLLPTGEGQGVDIRSRVLQQVYNMALFAQTEAVRLNACKILLDMTAGQENTPVNDSTADLKKATEAELTELLNRIKERP